MKKNTACLLFVLGIVFTFTFITMLQFVSPKKKLLLFLGVLILMHAGIALFIVSKKGFKKLYAAADSGGGKKKLPPDIKKCYNREYYFLLWYLPVLAVKFLLPLFTSLTFDAGTAEYFIKLGAVAAMSAVFAAESVFNAVKLIKFIKSSPEI